MRTLAILLVFFTLLVGGFLWTAYSGTQMEILSVTASVAPAVENEDLYNETRKHIQNGTFTGTVFSDTEFIMPDGYQFVTLTVRMSNTGFFPQEWIRIEVQPGDAAIAQLPETRTPSLAARSRGEFSTTVLTRFGADTQHTVTVTYYVLGHAFSVTARGE